MNEFEQRIWAAVYAQGLAFWLLHKEEDQARQSARINASNEVAFHRQCIDDGGSIFNEDLEDRSDV
jgi:hypothetical protein